MELTNLEVYVIKRALIEAGHEFYFSDIYSSDKEFIDCYHKLLNRFCDEDAHRVKEELRMVNYEE